MSIHSSGPKIPPLRGTVLLCLAGILFFPRLLPAVDFLGASLCKDHATTSVNIPEDSGLTLASVEVGEPNGLLMLLYATEGDALDRLDALMTRITGHPGQRDNDSIQWSGHSILAYASVVKKGTLAMAVSSDDACADQPPSPPPVATIPSVPPGEATPSVTASENIISEGSTEILPPAPPSTHEAPPQAKESDFSLDGRLTFSRSTPPWVDVMGLVENLSAQSYRLAAFDLSLFNSAGELLCVDTISVGMLKSHQKRAFRDALNCPDLKETEVAGYRLQFSGGY